MQSCGIFFTGTRRAASVGKNNVSPSGWYIIYNVMENRRYPIV